MASASEQVNAMCRGVNERKKSIGALTHLYAVKEQASKLNSE